LIKEDLEKKLKRKKPEIKIKGIFKFSPYILLKSKLFWRQTFYKNKKMGFLNKYLKRDEKKNFILLFWASNKRTFLNLTFVKFKRITFYLFWSSFSQTNLINFVDEAVRVEPPVPQEPKAPVKQEEPPVKKEEAVKVDVAQPQVGEAPKSAKEEENNIKDSNKVKQVEPAVPDPAKADHQGEAPPPVQEKVVLPPEPLNKPHEQVIISLDFNISALFSYPRQIWKFLTI